MLRPLPLLIPFLPLTAAFLLPIRGISNFDPDLPPSAVSDTDWFAAFTTPNATGSHSFPGRDTRTAYPGTLSAPWKYTLQVRDSVPRTNGAFTTGTWIQLEVPPSLTRENTTPLESPFAGTITDLGIPQDPSWEICTPIFLGPGLVRDPSIPSTMCQDPGMGVCLGDLKKYWEGNFGNRDVVAIGSESNCPTPAPRRAPESCKGFVNVNGSVAWGFGFEGTAAFNSEDKSVTPSTTPPNGTFSIMRFGSDFDNHKAGDRTFYDVAVRRAYIIAHVWGYKRGGNNTTAASAEVFCLEANDAVPNVGGNGNGKGNDTAGGGNGDAAGGKNDTTGGAGKNGAAKGHMARSLFFLAPAVAVALSWIAAY